MINLEDFQGEKTVNGCVFELNNANKVFVKNPRSMEALAVMKKTTPARIAIGRCGTRYKTATLLDFLASHAAAQDAVALEVSDDFINRCCLMKTKTRVSDKDEYLKKPAFGRKLDDASKKLVLENCEKRKQVQIIIVDGLSAPAIEANAEDTMAALIQGLEVEGLSVGTPFFVKYGRVAVQDEIAMLLDCDVIVEFVGERPGLVTAESMSAYLIYRPSENTVEADRSILSNIHRGGTPPAEAGAHLATLVKTILDSKASGTKLAEILKNKGKVE
ncbi:ethanolamine ammonia-lyase subunit EutC [Sporomusa acidovorans]|uniref:Ethanolamine ammonia-lyase small subunit n=1 Tax=Sporomusa acidovorans (strain ATCC 49682 / DSM 3132 / Mol) TaxID=1123286 RepID=A0ABZ3JAY5_SPOA4|nr:ethanolamine ammonia-lyase subunit EutC [Sporomusa acidovorans]OZC21717.1 ethanolamine ammonia-lyase light chain [Sporomusa acidovorans DSM 3132]SDD59205.1 Ethanolamine ammonia-lyase light chain [Sporomusa acidovorans]